MINEEITTIQLSKETKEQIKEFEKMGETYDDVILRLLKVAKEQMEK